MSNTQDDMVSILAEVPEPQRRNMTKTRLESFASMSEADRANAMKEMTLAKNKLGDDSRKKLIYTRLESLAEDFEPETRKKLMSAHMMSLMQLPKEEMAKEVNDMGAVMGQCHDQCKMKIAGTMKEIMLHVPPEKKKNMMEMMPQGMKGMLE